MSEIVHTSFREFDGVYERRKAEALHKHLMTLARIAKNAAKVSPYPERAFLWLEEWEIPHADINRREGRWLSELEVEWLA